MFFVALNLLLLYVNFASSKNACLSQTPCECVLPNNTVIDLSSVGTPGHPRFYSIQLKNNCSTTYLYSYNPCFAFDSPDKETVTKSGDIPCTGAAGCIKVPGRPDRQLPEEHAIGLQNAAVFGVNGSDYYINYTTPGQKKTLRVFLKCSESSTTSELSMDEPTPKCEEEDITILRLTSKCACPGGCQSSIPPPDSSGLSTGSKLLIAFFTIILAYLIIGVVWNYCNGSHGVNLIPNIEFWNELPTLIMEGIAFTCSCCASNRTYGEV